MRQPEGSGQANDLGVIGEDADNPGAALLLRRRRCRDLIVQSLQRVIGAMGPAPDLSWEATERQHVLPMPSSWTTQKRVGITIAVAVQKRGALAQQHLGAGMGVDLQTAAPAATGGASGNAASVRLRRNCPGRVMPPSCGQAP